MSDERDAFLDEVAALRREIAVMNRHRFIKVHNSMPRLILFQLARGLAFGLGTVLGASVLLSVLAWSLSQIDFIPIIGDWAREIIALIQPEIDVDVRVESDGSTTVEGDTTPNE
ncbi:DUF5665 domain-containing protein [Jannaschia aquimarina]|uniref:Uncharacterized protein n=1 Tax=Jannaschia aquimarina TaxID=935700 RepID=A0A0D1E9D3_9RHOB|nr:DUF5665 domain-containing protein [Jannaschia aquimarina]KIT14239.1 hypothetical protein jaqu_40330 [Jannaschia aquimarina]SNS48965.1 hypothetical protein SAMN05421775_101153 [Jannaschia aquimarina]